MAEFNADIQLRLRTEELDRKLKAVERKIGQIGANPGGGALVNQYNKINKQLDEATREVIKRGLAEKTNTRELKKQTVELAKQQKVRRSRRQNALLGGGFPLLFGAGPGQALAGLAGGAVGGFAGGIAAQAGVAAISGLNDAIVETAAVTTSTAASFEFLSEKELYSSDETRRLADELAELGRVEELAALNTKELVNMIGNEGVNNLQALDTEWRELLSNVAELGLAIAAFISKYLEPVIALLNNAVGSINTRNRFESLRGDVAGTDVGKQLEQAIREARQNNGRGSRLGALQTSDMEALLKRFGPLREVTAKVPVTEQDPKDFKPPKNSAADDLERQLAAGEKLARQFRQRVEILNAESNLAENLLRITHQREEAAIRIKETAAASQQAELLAANAELLRLERIKAIEEFTKKTVEDVEKYTEKIDDQVALREREEALIREGLNPQLAEALAKIEQQADKQREILEERIKNLDAAIQQLEADGASAEELEKQRKELERIKGLRSAIDEAEGKAKGNAAIENPGKVQAYINKTKEQLADVEGQIVKMAQVVESAMANAISGAVISLVDGSKKIEDVLSDMFRAIGEAFIKMAAEIIAKQLIMIALQSILRALGGGGGGASSVPSSAYGDMSVAGPGFFSGGMIPGYADGGPVDNATPYIVGERGPELFVPNNPGTIVTTEQSRAQLDMYSPGNAVDAPAGPMNVNMNYSGPTMAFDDKRYVPVEAIPDIIRDAAKQGEQRTLASMRNKVSTRNRVGI